MEAIEQESLLPVIEFAVVPKYRIQAAVMPAESLVLFDMDVIAESIGAGKIVFCACIVD